MTDSTGGIHPTGCSLNCEFGPNDQQIIIINIINTHCEMNHLRSTENSSLYQQTESFSESYRRRLGESYRRRLRSLLCFCYVFRASAN